MITPPESVRVKKSCPAKRVRARGAGCRAVSVPAVGPARQRATRPAAYAAPGPAQGGGGTPPGDGAAESGGARGAGARGGGRGMGGGGATCSAGAAPPPPPPLEPARPPAPAHAPALGDSAHIQEGAVGPAREGRGAADAGRRRLPPPGPRPGEDEAPRASARAPAGPAPGPLGPPHPASGPPEPPPEPPPPPGRRGAGARPRVAQARRRSPPARTGSAAPRPFFLPASPAPRRRFRVQTQSAREGERSTRSDFRASTWNRDGKKSRRCSSRRLEEDRGVGAPRPPGGTRRHATSLHASRLRVFTEDT